MTFDILIKNGTVVDGTGQKNAYRADVGINGDKIFEVGDLSKAKAKKEIDATGLIVAPGFVDVQNHSDSYGSLLRDNHLESLIRQGITTILIGQCGSSLAPLIKGSLASIQKWTAVEGFNINWTSQAEFMAEMSRRGAGVNLATLTGHATLRRDFIGDSTRPLTPKEELQVSALLKRSLQEGALGLSVGLAYSHERLATEEEIHKLLRIVQVHKGVASFHLRNEGPEIFAAVNEVFGFLRHVPVRSKISHLKILGEKNQANAEKLLNMLEVAARDGVPIYFDVYPYLASAVVLYLLLPDWATSSGKNELIKKIKNPETRKDIIRAMAAQNYPYDKITVATSTLGPTFTGKSLAEIAKAQNAAHPAEAVLNLLVASRDQIIVFWHDVHEEILEMMLKHPLALIATDGSGYNIGNNTSGLIPHPRSFGTTAKILGRYVRDRKILNLEEAIHKMSGLPAQWLGLKDRGAVIKNYYADLAIFDPENIVDLSTYENPFKYPAGLKYVLVNGTLAIENGEYKKILAGQVLGKNI